MGFREGETERFPFDRTDKKVWYAIIIQDILFPRVAFASSKTGKKEFLGKIKELHKEGRFYLILGVWQGEWRTDIFVLDEELVKKELRL